MPLTDIRQVKNPIM